MRLQTVLNRVHRQRAFVYGEPRLFEDGGPQIVVPVVPRKNSRPTCSGCKRPGGHYDTLSERRFEFVPLWGIAVFLVYAMRRVNCARCGVKVELVPWAEGKSPITTTYAYFLAGWAKRLSWKEVAEAFRTTWDTVFRAVSVVVSWGLANRDLTGIRAIGVDEVLWHRGHRYLTVVYQIDAHCRRLLWIARDRTEESFEGFFRFFGLRARWLRFVCSDMWQPYLEVFKRRAKDAVHVLDRFHVVARLSKAIDEVRAAEAKRMARDGYEPILKRTRWCLLKRPENLTDNQRGTLRNLLQYNLRTVRAYLLKEELGLLWKYVSPTWAGKFLDHWCTKVMGSRLEPMKKIARSFRTHRELILNWFRARGEISAAAVEGLNNKLKLVTRRAYGFRTFAATEIALYHALGDLPHPPMTHRFF